MAQVDYRSYSYNHAAFGLASNGVVFGCPRASDQGCVSPVGASIYNAAFNPGPLELPECDQRQRLDHRHRPGGRRSRRSSADYISVGYVFRTFNYLNYPVQTGLGIGLDKLPDVDRAISVYGNFWAFFNVQGNYTGPTAASLGLLSGYKISMNYRMFTYRIGATFNLPKTPYFIDVSDVGDNETRDFERPANTVDNAVMFGAGASSRTTEACSPLGEIWLLVGLSCVTIPLVALAKRADIPYPVVLVLGGLVLGFVPGLPQVRLEPASRRSSSCRRYCTGKRSRRRPT